MRASSLSNRLDEVHWLKYSPDLSADTQVHDNHSRNDHRHGKEPEPGTVRARGITNDTDNRWTNRSAEVAERVDQTDDWLLLPTPT